MTRSKGSPKNAEAATTGRAQPGAQPRVEGQLTTPASDASGTGNASVERPEARLYDEGLLDRCRGDWRRGNWRALAALSTDDLELHSQRARLALMVASAHQALGQASATRLFVRLARQWGAEQDLIVRVLVGGVHNTLARAAALSPSRHVGVAHHFREAVAAGSTGSSRWLATTTRAEHQLGQINMGHLLGPLLAGPGLNAAAGLRPLVPSPFRELRADLQKQAEQLAARQKEQIEQLTAARKAIETAVRRETANAVRQIEAFGNLQSYLARGEAVPELHGWPVSPDLAMLLVRTIEQEHFDAVVEFGSGSSTLLIARALGYSARRHGLTESVPQYAFEHLAEYHDRTQQMLQGAGLSQDVQLLLAPLFPFKTDQDEEFAYYRCDEALAGLAQRLAATHNPRVLYFVDGPPGSTGPLARYPAVPMVLRHLPQVEGVLLLDDYLRPDERAVAKRWMQELERAGRKPVLVEHELEKMAATVRFSAANGSSRI